HDEGPLILEQPIRPRLVVLALPAVAFEDDDGQLGFAHEPQVLPPPDLRGDLSGQVDRVADRLPVGLRAVAGQGIPQRQSARPPCELDGEVRGTPLLRLGEGVEVLGALRVRSSSDVRIAVDQRTGIERGESHLCGSTMSESARSTPANRCLTCGASIAASPSAPSMWSQKSNSSFSAAIPAISSMVPKFVVPEVATTAITASPCSTRACRTPAGRRIPSSPVATGGTSTCMTSAAEATEEWASALHTITHRAGLDSPSCSFFALRAATRAERLPMVPPWTKTPPAVSGRPNSPASQRSTSFSAWTTPAPSSQDPP